MERALADLSAGQVVQPVRLMLPVAEHNGILPHDACLHRGSAGGQAGHLLSRQSRHSHPSRADPAVSPGDRRAPRHHGYGRLITEMRTAAVLGGRDATQRYADASVLAILGSGVQAGSHLEALRLVREFREVRVGSPTTRADLRRAIRRARGRFGGRGGSRAGRHSRRGHQLADAVLLGEWLSAGTHVNAVGACRPDWRELDDELVGRARLYVESREAATRESGDVIAAGEVVAEIGEVIAGTRPGRQSAEEVTLFKSVGVAVEDVVAADMVHRSAVRGQAKK